MRAGFWPAGLARTAEIGPFLRIIAATILLALPARTGHAEEALPPRALAELPHAPSVEFPVPEPEALEQLDGVLQRIQSADDSVRESALREVLEAEPNWLPAAARRLSELGDHADRARMKDTLLSVRKKVLAQRKKERSAADDDAETPDYLEMLSSQPRVESPAWRDLTQVLTLSRVFVAVGSTPAVRALIQIYVRFEFLRIDTQRQLKKLGERAVPALIEATRHPAEKVSTWAARQLDMLGRAVPSEAVQIEDFQILADVLRAYGRIREPDAARVIISFANSERGQLREAARQAVSLMGEVSNWQLRDSYENTVGKKPRRDWTWERTARELFAEYDQLRLSAVYSLFDEGLRAQKSGDLEKMRKAYDAALTRLPVFDRGPEMVPGYLEYARSAGSTKPSDALDALSRAERLTPDLAAQKRIRALKLALQAQILQARGIADAVLLERSLELDPTNNAAQTALTESRAAQSTAAAERNRLIIAGTIGALALLAITLILALRPRALPVAEPQAQTLEEKPQADAPDSKSDPT